MWCVLPDTLHTQLPLLFCGLGYNEMFDENATTLSEFDHSRHGPYEHDVELQPGFTYTLYVSTYHYMDTPHTHFMTVST